MYLKCALITILLVMLCSCQHRYVRPENYKNPQAEIQTELGTIIIELYEDKVPNTVSNFILLAEAGFYDGQFFHAIRKGYMVQAGCPFTKPSGDPQKRGTGGPGYSIAEEFHPDLSHDRKGVLSMAKGHFQNADGRRFKNSTGSQFFITLDKIPNLDTISTVFGRVIEGFAALEAIENRIDKKRPVSFIVNVIRKNDIKYFVNKKEE